MNPRLITCAFLIGCYTTLALGQESLWELGRGQEDDSGVDQTVDRAKEQREMEEFSAVYKEWLSKQSNDLLDIIKILYKGREAELKKLESAQSAMELADQVERRIALIKETLSAKETK